MIRICTILPLVLIEFKESMQEVIFLRKVELFLVWLDQIMWGPWMLMFLLGTGCYLMVRLRFIPLRNLKFALLCTIGMEGTEEKQKKVKQASNRKGISSFSSLTTELAATIGTGNIVGVASALILGGPGALLWMIVSSAVGMATKLVESMLSVKYRSKNEIDEWVGGPMYTMRKALPFPTIGKVMGICYALFAVMASLGMGNMVQSHSIGEAMKVCFGVPIELTGLVTTLLVILIMLGGIKSIACVTQILVPFMGILYIVGSLLVILTHIENLGEGLRMMAVLAVKPTAITGGLCGFMSVNFKSAFRWGISRGVFSNEAGLGASGISAASANIEDYIKQAYISMTSVFLDTIVICTLTGLALICSGVVGSLDARGEFITGTELTILAFQTTFGEKGGAFISVCIALFAFATIIAWAYQGEKAYEFLVKKSRYCVWYRFFYALIVFVGTVSSLEVVWNFSDICNAFMVIPNLICVLLLSEEACKEILLYHEST